MIVEKKAIARRTVLRGIGAGLALPFLDAMAPALSASISEATQLASATVTIAGGTYAADSDQFVVGLTVSRPEYESRTIRSKFQRLSSGSRPLNTDPSSFHQCVKIPAVSTPLRSAGFGLRLSRAIVCRSTTVERESSPARSDASWLVTPVISPPPAMPSESDESV